MATWTILGVSSILGVITILFSIYSSGNSDLLPVEYVRGRNNTVLFVTDSHAGFSHVVLATASSLLKNHPDVEIHWASYPKQRGKVQRISDIAQAARGACADDCPPPVSWHDLPGRSYIEATGMTDYRDSMCAPGAAGIGSITPNIEWAAAPWTDEEDTAVHDTVSELIEDIDPSLVVVDHMMSIPLATATKLKRRLALISPNDLVSLFAMHQPYGKAFWKYPAPNTGFSYPISWSQIPENIYVWSRIIYSFMFSERYQTKNRFRETDLKLGPINIDFAGRPDIHFISAGCQACLYELETLPGSVYQCGPLALEVSKVEDEDPALAKWLSRAPTVLSMMGSWFKYDEQRATAMALALKAVLDQTNMQILWKFSKMNEFNDTFLEPLRGYIDSGRLRMTEWISVDSSALLNSGHVVASIHHGGASCYHEALDAGVVQIILPLWFDLYGFASAVVDLGIGVWPGRNIAPEWSVEALSKGFLHALQGEDSSRMKAAAKEKQKQARLSGGRDKAASIVAGLASQADAS